MMRRRLAPLLTIAAFASMVVAAGPADPIRALQGAVMGITRHMPDVLTRVLSSDPSRLIVLALKDGR
ncbi:hypothetical protein ETD86_41500 [Nonomuraea turkmeniaca]|uniref:Serine hydrolase n=1 Tax=Nonomuraea turkmeniaca TaxID=103838 RepID=A0A5S4F1V2_9ACTN|nr:hypothetical protein [Nonomuraea turkmeniaca]TMR09947.1 hypothetical protein ETD86_41500 [Nonomuraea turkmeniaca]